MSILRRIHSSPQVPFVRSARNRVSRRAGSGSHNWRRSRTASCRSTGWISPAKRWKGGAYRALISLSRALYSRARTAGSSTAVALRTANTSPNDMLVTPCPVPSSNNTEPRRYRSAWRKTGRVVSAQPPEELGRCKSPVPSTYEVILGHEPDWLVEVPATAKIGSSLVRVGG
jgi:hypothetical protein